MDGTCGQSIYINCQQVHAKHAGEHDHCSQRSVIQNHFRFCLSCYRSATLLKTESTIHDTHQETKQLHQALTEVADCPWRLKCQHGLAAHFDSPGFGAVDPHLDTDDGLVPRARVNFECCKLRVAVGQICDRNEY